MDHQRKNHKPIRTIVLGCGNIGSLWDEVGGLSKGLPPLTHLGALSQNSAFCVTGIYDTNETRAAEASKCWGGLPVLDSFESLSADNTDLVVLATPAIGRDELIKLFFQKNIKCIFSEKPLTSNPSDAIKLLGSLEKKNHNLLVNYSRTFSEDYQNLKAIIKAGELGEFAGGSAVYGKGLLNNGSHIISTIIDLIGAPLKSERGDRIVDERSEDPTFDFTLYFNDNAKINVSGTDHRNYTILEIDLLFTEGRIKILDSGRKITIYKKQINSLYPGYSLLAAERELEPDLNLVLTNAYEVLGKFFNQGDDSRIMENVNLARNTSLIFQTLLSGVTQ